MAAKKNYLHGEIVNKRQILGAFMSLSESWLKYGKEAVQRQASSVCYSLAMFTEPYGVGAKAQAKGEGAIARDIRYAIRVMTPRHIEWFESRGFKLDGPLRLRHASFEYIALNASVAEIERYHEARRVSRGRVVSVAKYGSTLTTTVARREAYIRAKQKLVGLAKASWLDGMADKDRAKARPPRWLRRDVSGLARRVESGDGRSFCVDVRSRLAYMSDHLIGATRLRRAVTHGYYGLAEEYFMSVGSLLKRYQM